MVGSKEIIISLVLSWSISFIINSQQYPGLSIPDPDNTYAIIIGNENYQLYSDDFTEDVLHAIYDAERFNNILINKMGLNSKNISFYTDATNTHIKLALAKIKNLKSQSGSSKLSIIFYYNGKINEVIGEGLYLTPIDSDGENKFFSFSLTDLCNRISAVSGAVNYIILDSPINTVHKFHSLLDTPGLSYSDNDINPKKFIISIARPYPEFALMKAKGENYSVSSISDSKPPELEIFSPTGNIRSVTQERLLIKGRALDNSGIYLVAVNGEEAHLNTDGSFLASVVLNEGENNISIIAIDGKMNETEINLKINRKISVSQKEEIPPNYISILIGINDYSDPLIPDLSGPLSDIVKVKEVLNKNYNFTEANTIIISNPSYSGIMRMLDSLKNHLNENDNLLLYYSGHGSWDDKTKTGYWLPSDAASRTKSNWIRNSTITSFISETKSKHTLLISDACFSGSIFRTRGFFDISEPDILQLYLLDSKKALTSGDLREVPDESIFNLYLVKYLEENQENFLTSTQLYNMLKEQVVNRTDNIPQFGKIKNSGDKGGDFIFVRKRNASNR